MGEIGEAHGIPIPELAPETTTSLQECIYSNFGIKNPIDNGGLLMYEPREKRLKALDIIAGDPSIDIVVIGIGTGQGVFADVMARDLRDWAPTAPKPVVAVWAAASNIGPAYAELVSSGVTVFHSFTRCFEALRDYTRYQQRRSSFRARANVAPQLSAAQAATLEMSGLLPSDAAVALVAGAGIRLAREHVVSSAHEAGAAAPAIGASVVLKIQSPDFPHKSDAGLVKVGVQASAAAAEADELLARARLIKPDATIEGIQVQEFVSGGVEMILGLSLDPQCGPCLTLGFGGIFAELLRDVATRPLPVDEGDIHDMIASLRLAPLLDGWRGAPASDRPALVEMALQLAALGLAAGDRLAELDLNPVIVLPDGAVAVDVLAVIS